MIPKGISQTCIAAGFTLLRVNIAAIPKLSHVNSSSYTTWLGMADRRYPAFFWT
jgi:hypothetical protein